MHVLLATVLLLRAAGADPANVACAGYSHRWLASTCTAGSLAVPDTGACC